MPSETSLLLAPDQVGGEGAVQDVERLDDAGICGAIVRAERKFVLNASGKYVAREFLRGQEVVQTAVVTTGQGPEKARELFDELGSAIVGCVAASPGAAHPASGPPFTIDTTALEGVAKGDLGWSFAFAGPAPESKRQERVYSLSGSTLVIVGAVRSGNDPVATNILELIGPAVQRVKDNVKPA